MKNMPQLDILRNLSAEIRGAGRNCMARKHMVRLFLHYNMLVHVYLRGRWPCMHLQHASTLHASCVQQLRPPCCTWPSSVLSRTRWRELQLTSGCLLAPQRRCGCWSPGGQGSHLTAEPHGLCAAVRCQEQARDHTRCMWAHAVALRAAGGISICLDSVCGITVVLTCKPAA